MRFQDELVDPEELKFPATESVKVRPQERAMAVQLIENLAESFDPSKYHDEYEDKLHEIIKANAPVLTPKTWYGMPAYTNADGKVVVFFQDAGKFNYRYSTLGFQDAAHLDDGDLWPVSYALRKWSPVVEKKVVELVKAAIS